MTFWRLVLVTGMPNYSLLSTLTSPFIDAGQDLHVGRIPKQLRNGLKEAKKRFRPPPACAYPDRPIPALQKPVPPASRNKRSGRGGRAAAGILLSSEEALAVRLGQSTSHEKESSAINDLVQPAEAEVVGPVPSLSPPGSPFGPQNLLSKGSDSLLSPRLKSDPSAPRRSAAALANASAAVVEASNGSQSRTHDSKQRRPRAGLIPLGMKDSKLLSAIEKRLTEKISTDWVPWMDGIVEPVVSTRVVDTAAASAAAVAGAPAGSGVADTETLTDFMTHELLNPVTVLKEHRAQLSSHIVHRNMTVPTAADRRARHIETIAKRDELAAIVTERRDEMRATAREVQLADVDRWERLRAAEKQAEQVASLLVIVSTVSRLQSFVHELTHESSSFAAAKNEAFAARVLQQHMRHWIEERWRFKYQHSMDMILKHVKKFVQRHRDELRRSSAKMLRSFLHDIKFSSTQMYKAVVKFRWNVAKCQRIAKTFLVCKQMRLQTLATMLDQIETRLLASNDVSDGLFKNPAHKHTSTAADEHTAARKVAAFGSAIGPEARTNIIKTLMDKCKLNFFSKRTAFHEGRKLMSGQVRQMSVSDARSILAAQIQVDMTVSKKEAHEPLFCLFSYCRKPMTKLVQAHYRTHRHVHLFACQTCAFVNLASYFPCVAGSNEC